jgi:hypothetical protein
MDNITPDQQRDTEPAVFNGNTLKFVNNLNVHDIDHRADPACTQTLTQVVGRVPVTRLELTHLPDFFRQAHLAQQRFGPACRVAISIQHARSRYTHNPIGL